MHRGRGPDSAGSAEWERLPALASTRRDKALLASLARPTADRSRAAAVAVTPSGVEADLRPRSLIGDSGHKSVKSDERRCGLPQLHAGSHRRTAAAGHEAGKAGVAKQGGGKGS